MSTTATTHAVTIEDWRPTALNVLMRMHPQKANRLKQTDGYVIGLTARSQDVPDATGKRRVSLHVTLTGRQKAVDPDAYWKVTLDGLKAAGFLIDDSARYCELGPVTFARGERTSTTITLEDC